MFGYCGDVVFPSLVIAQIVSAIDNGVLFSTGATVEIMHEVVLSPSKSPFSEDRRHRIRTFQFYTHCAWELMKHELFGMPDLVQYQEKGMEE